VFPNLPKTIPVLLRSRTDSIGDCQCVRSGIKVISQGEDVTRFENFSSLLG
jgi:hypothetical protein